MNSLASFKQHFNIYRFNAF